jgi:hypothetical protein
MRDLPEITSVQLATALERRGFVCTVYANCLRLERPSDGRVLVVDDAGPIPRAKLAVLMGAAGVGVEELRAAFRLVHRRSGPYAVLFPDALPREMGWRCG